MAEICNWNQYDDEYASYETDCGQSFVLNEGSPADNRMKFCCYCGKQLVGHEFVEEIDEPDDDPGPIIDRDCDYCNRIT